MTVSPSKLQEVNVDQGHDAFRSMLFPTLPSHEQSTVLQVLALKLKQLPCVVPVVEQVREPSETRRRHASREQCLQ